MKLLLDACVWGGARGVLEASGHDVIWVGDWAEDPGDEEILARAESQGRVLVTLDRHFGELAVVHGRAHAGIVRLVDLGAKQQGRICADILIRYASDIEAGAIVTVEPGRVRVRSAEPRPGEPGASDVE